MTDSLTPAPALTERAPLIPVRAWRLGSWQLAVNRQTWSDRELADRYDRVALGWCAKLDRFRFSEAYEALWREVLDEESAGPVRALDCGVGTGALSAAFGKAHRGPVMIDGIDVSADMLARAEQTYANAGLATRLQTGDVRDLPFEDARFDVVMAGHVLEHLSDPQAALAEMHRVLRPGGLALICVTRRSLLGTYIQLKWRTRAVIRNEMADWLGQAGFSDVHCHPLRVRSLTGPFSLAAWARKPIE